MYLVEDRIDDNSLKPGRFCFALNLTFRHFVAGSEDLSTLSPARKVSHFLPNQLGVFVHFNN